MNIPELLGGGVVNKFGFARPDTGAVFVFDGPFEFAYESGHFEVYIPTDPDDYAGIHPETAESYEDATGDIGIAFADAEIPFSGIIKASDIVEDRLCIVVDAAGFGRKR